MRFSTFCSAFVLTSVFATSTFAAEGAEGSSGSRGATLTLNLPALAYSTKNTKMKPEGTSSTSSTTEGFSTAGTDGTYAEISWGAYNAYFYPFQDAKTVALSYMVNDTLEVGLSLGLNEMSTNKPKEKHNENTVGAFVSYSPTLGTVPTEMVLGYTTVSGVDETRDATTDAKIKKTSSNNELALSIDAVVPISNNLHYLGGISYKIQNTNEKDTTGRTKNTIGVFGVNIATLRLVVN